MAADSTLNYYRVRVFVDFWNYTLAMKNTDAQFQTDWSLFGPQVAQAAVAAIDPTVQHAFQGMSVYGSYDPSKDHKLINWVKTVLDRFPGVGASFSQRHRKHKAPSCPRCHSTVNTCPECGGDMRGTEEKGVDVRMTVEMISLAMHRSYDVAVLVSSDRDFIPVAEFLDSRGIIVIHGAFGNSSAHLTQSCWTRIDLPRMREKFKRRRATITPTPTLRGRNSN